MHHDHVANRAEMNQNNGHLMCPVMKGVPVEKIEAEKAGLVREYKGIKYYFCCDACLVDFDQNPEAYTQ